MFYTRITLPWQKKLIATIVILNLFLWGSGAALGQNEVGLYAIWELQVTNPNSYTNPFDFREIELQATFTGPSGKQIDFFGFYDGDGRGGQTGSVWKLRFMPDEVGRWSYTYSWTDGTAGGSGSFEVVDTGLPGPLKAGPDNPWYFVTARNEPFHFRGYSLGWVPRFAPSRDITQERQWIKDAIQTYLVKDGYNATDWGGLINRGEIPDEANNWLQSWWLNKNEKKRFNLPAWHAYEDILGFLAEKKIYTTSYAGFVYQGFEYEFADFQVFLRYYVARLGPYYNLFGFGPTWEVLDVYSVTEVDQIMQYVHDIDPWKRPVGVHDTMRSEYANWGGVSLRQRQSRNVFDGNSRTAGQHGGVEPPFDNKPIIASEDLWERPSGKFEQPRNAEEVRRGAWGIQLAGVLTMYSEWNDAAKEVGPGTGQGEEEVRRMFDFYYAKTNYRHYQQLNHLVSSRARQIASGIPGQEYLVYDEDGGTITIDLSEASTADVFSVLWFDPKRGSEQSAERLEGGRAHTLTSPFPGDSVLLLKLLPDTTPPTAPQELVAKAINASQIDLTWQTGNDRESGINRYKVYRNGLHIGQSPINSYSDTGLTANTTYTYEVSAVNGIALESTKSMQTIATTLQPALDDTSPPTTPQNLTAVAKSASQIDLTWQTADDPESGIGSYKIYRDDLLIGQSLTNSFSDTSLAAGSTYLYEVAAVNGVGLNSAKSESTSATTFGNIFYFPIIILSVFSSGLFFWLLRRFM